MKVDFGGVEETVVTREEFTLEKSLSTLKDVPISVLGYGSQGPGQSQNLRDNGFNVVVGQRESYSKPGEEPTTPATQSTFSTKKLNLMEKVKKSKRKLLAEVV